MFIYKIVIQTLWTIHDLILYKDTHVRSFLWTGLFIFFTKYVALFISYPIYKQTCSYPCLVRYTDIQVYVLWDTLTAVSYCIVWDNTDLFMSIPWGKQRSLLYLILHEQSSSNTYLMRSREFFFILSW